MKNMKKMLSFLFVLSMVLSYVPMPALAVEDGTCPHHTHDDQCGYVAKVEGKECTHQCNESCTMKDVTQCVHNHEAEGCIHTPAADLVPCDHVHDDSCNYSEAEDTCDHQHGACAYKVAVSESWSCGHVCTKESGCVKAVCAHEHNDDCGYVKAVGSPCTFDCEECKAPQVDEAVEAVKAQLEALPTVEELSSMTIDEKIALHNGDYLTAGNAYNALTEEQKAQVDASKLMALADYFADPSNLQTLETHEHDNISWNAITSLGSNLYAGNYYLQNNITCTSNLNIYGTVNLCLNGNKLIWNGSQRKITINSGATLNIYDCKGSGTCSLVIENNGTLNIYGGTYGGQYIVNGGTSYLQVIENKGTLHIYNATVKADIVPIDNTGKLTIDDGSFEVASAWTYVCCIDNAGGTAEINGGSFTSSSSHTIYSNTGSPSLTINGGTFSNTDDNSYVLYVTHGTCTINKGTFNACNTNTIKASAPVSSKTVIAGGNFYSSSRQAITSLGSNRDTIEISGGTFETIDNIALVNASDGCVSGGTFKRGINLSNLNAKLAEGYAYYQNGEKVIPINSVAITGGDVEVKKIASTYTVTVTTDGNGTASANPASGTAGTKVTLTATPSEGYQFKEWQVTPDTVTITDNNFTIPTANVEIKAIFKPIEKYSVWVNNVQVTDTNKDNVLEDGTVSYDPVNETLTLNNATINVSNGHAIKSEGALTITGTAASITGGIRAAGNLNIQANIGQMLDGNRSAFESEKGTVTISGTIGDITTSANGISGKGVTITSSGSVGKITATGNDASIGIRSEGDITIAGTVADIHSRNAGIFTGSGSDVTISGTVGNITSDTSFAIMASKNISITGSIGDLKTQENSIYANEDIAIEGTVGTINSNRAGVASNVGSITISGKVETITSNERYSITAPNGTIGINNGAVVTAVSQNEYGLPAGKVVIAEGSGALAVKKTGDTVVLAEVYGSYPTSSFKCEKLEVKAGAKLTISEGATVEVTTALTNNGAIAIVNNGTLKLPENHSTDGCSGGTLYIGEKGFRWNDEDKAYRCLNDAHTENTETGCCSDCGVDLAVAEVIAADSSTKRYSSLQNALNAARFETGATVKLLRSVTDLTETLLIEGGSFTLDLNEKEISSAADYTLDFGGGTHSVTGGTVNGSIHVRSETVVTLSANVTTAKKHTVLVDGNGKLTVSGGSIYNTSANGSALAASENGELIVSGGTVSGTYFGVHGSGNSSVTLNGGSISGGTAGVYAEGNTQITINTGFVSSTGGKAIWTFGGTTNVTGGTFSGNVSVRKTAGTVSLSGGTFTGGICVENANLNEILANGYVYYQNGQVCEIDADATAITGGDVTVVHIHNWNYKATDINSDQIMDTITATCNVDGCPNTSGGRVTLTDPDANTSITYNGKSQDADTEGSFIAGAPTVSYQYKATEGGDYGAPKDDFVSAGFYKVTMTAPDDKTTVSVEYEIQKRAVTITANEQSITYGGSIISDTAQVTAENLVEGHTLGGITLTTENTNVTTNGTITPSAATIRDDNSRDVTANYAITYQNGTLTINKATDPTVTEPTATAIFYGQTLTDSKLSLDGWSWADASTMPGSTDAHEAVLTVDDANYDYTGVVGYDSQSHTVTRKVSVQVNKATPAITVTTVPSSAAPEKTVTVTASIANPHNANLTDLPELTLTYKIGDAEPQTITGNSFTIPRGTAENTVITITAATAGNDKYAAASETAEVTVNAKLTQTITAPTGIVVTYGKAPFSLEAEAVGALTYAVNNDVVSIDAEGKVTVLKKGNAIITVTAAETQDYAPASVTVPITVNPAALTITAENKTAVVGAAMPTLTYTVTGLVGDDTLTTVPTLTCNADMKTAGEFDIIPSGAAAGDNYTINYVNGKLTVKKEYKVTVSDTTNGTVTTNVSKAAEGTEVAITVTPKSGYKLSTLTVKDAAGKSYVVSTDNNGKYYFTMPDAEVTVTATFSKISTATADPTNPKTGDDFQLVLWSSILCGSALGMAVLLTDNKKRIY